MKRVYLIILALVLVLALGLTGCTEYAYGPITFDQTSTSSKVESNGGLVAKQGNYLYFVNGIGSATMDNKFGEVVRGAIMRYTLDAQGNVVDNSLVTVVPKVVYSGQKEVGFAIFGDWLYYVSPTVKVDKQGNRMTTIVDFYRVKLDGTGTQKIAEIASTSVNYVFTEKAFVYYLDGNIYSIDLTAESFEAKVIAEDVTGYMLPELQDYDPADTTLSTDEYIYYSVADEDDYETANHLFAIKPDGTGKVQLIGPTTYTTGANDYQKRANVTPIMIENGVLYYSKTYAEAGSTVAEGVHAGLYCYDLGTLGETFTFDVDKEVKLAVKSISALYPVADGIVLGKDGAGMTLYNIIEEDGEIKKINEVKSFNTTVDVVAISDVVATDSALSFKAIFKRSSNEDLFSYKFVYDVAEDGTYTLNTAELEQAVRLTNTTSTASYLEAEQIGANFYYENEWGYISCVKVGDLDAEPKMLGKMTTADKEAYDEAMAEDAE